MLRPSLKLVSGASDRRAAFGNWSTISFRKSHSSSTTKAVNGVRPIYRHRCDRISNLILQRRAGCSDDLGRFG